jgi:hypothetical protein
MSFKKALSQAGNFPVALDEEEGPEYWQNHLDNWTRSGLSQAAYCRNNDLDYDRFRKWKERLSAYPSASTSIKLVEVKRDFTLNRSSDFFSSGPSFGPGGAGINGSSGRIKYPGANGICGGTGGYSGIRFWCGEFCIEVDVKFSSDTLRQLVRTLQGVYVKSKSTCDACGGDNGEADEEAEGVTSDG